MKNIIKQATKLNTKKEIITSSDLKILIEGFELMKKYVVKLKKKVDK